MITVIMAGGKGTRIAEINSEIPKPMIPICGKPILEHQIECLKKQGFLEIIIVIGHLGHFIQGYFGNGDKFGVLISYIVESEPLGTAGALFLLKETLTEDFLLINGDIVFDIDMSRFLDHHRKSAAKATIFTHPNSHPYDSGIIIGDDHAKVIDWLHKEDKRLWYRNRVNAGIHILSPKILEMFTELQKKDLDRDVLKPLIASGELYLYDSPEYVKDMGTPDRYYSVTKDLQNGIVNAKNLLNKQKAIFLDRDGTINVYKGFLRNIDDFELLEGSADAIRLINKSGYLAIVVTNQPVIARGEVTTEELLEIHNKMETLLGQEGAFVDGIFFCPHHPDSGFDGERKEYKIICDCRKPKPGLLLKAARQYNIDLSKSWMIGDDINDINAGINAGCRVAHVGGNHINQAVRYPNLYECIREILNSKMV